MIACDSLHILKRAGLQGNLEVIETDDQDQNKGNGRYKDHTGQYGTFNRTVAMTIHKTNLVDLMPIALLFSPAKEERYVWLQS